MNIPKYIKDSELKQNVLGGFAIFGLLLGAIASMMLLSSLVTPINQIVFNSLTCVSVVTILASIVLYEYVTFDTEETILKKLVANDSETIELLKKAIKTNLKKSAIKNSDLELVIVPIDAYAFVVKAYPTSNESKKEYFSFHHISGPGIKIDNVKKFLIDEAKNPLSDDEIFKNLQKDNIA